VYVAVAHLSLALAFLLIALEPSRFMGFFYHPKLIAIVHLVTLGWITATTLGLSYVAGPLALRLTVPATRWDAVACGLFVIGASGVVTHFWVEEYLAVAWAGVLMLPALGLVAVRMVRALRGGGAPLPVRLCVGVAYVNLLVAALLAVHLAMKKSSAGAVPLPHVYAHVHLAAAGWATLMVMGVGFRLLSMLFPAAPPGNRAAWATLVLFEAGVLGLAASFMAGWPLWPFAILLVLGLAVFLGAVVRMRFRMRPPPAKLRRPDFGVLQVALALLSLGATAGIGLFLALSPEIEVRWVMAYGVVGLVGFLSQMILGVEMRLLPMFSFTEAYARSGHAALPPSPHDMPRRPLQGISVLAWAVGVPLLAWGLSCRAEEPFAEEAVRAGAGALLAGTLAAAASTARVLRVAYRR
jgi:hypothetical protein